MIGAPKGLPENVKQRLVESLSKAAGSQTFKDVMAKAGNTPLWKPPAEAEAFAKSEYDRFGQIYK
jgi:tripartite-type tricarboxylate transporter receptor subunit TctC